MIQQILTIFCAIGFASAVTLDEAYDLAEKNAPIGALPSVISESSRLSVQTVRANYLPIISASGKITNQSDAMTIGRTKLDTDQWGVQAELSQTIWDGGMVKAQRKMIESSAETEQAQNRVSIFELKSSVNRAYFAILSADEQKKLNDSRRNDLTKRLATIQARIANGTAEEAELAAVQVELVKLDQADQEIGSFRKSAVSSLEILLGKDLSDSEPVELPAETAVNSSESNRPELALFAAQDRQFLSQKSEVNARLMPRFAVFGQYGVGKPGLVMTNTEPDDWWLVGARFNVDISAPWFTRGAQLAKIEQNRKRVEIQKQAFLLTNKTQIEQKRIEIAKLDSLIVSDQKLVDLRGTIRTAFEAKYKNGVVTINDMLSRVDDEESAKAVLANRKIQKVQAEWDLRVLKGDTTIQ